MEKIRTLVTILAVAFGISFLDGMFGWGFDDGFYLLLGIVSLTCIVWLLYIVNKKENRKQPTAMPPKIDDKV